MKFTAIRKYWFVPDIGDNLKLEDDKQLQIEIIRPTVENQNELSKVSVRKADDGSVTADSKFNVSKILHDCVGEIKNLEVEETSCDGKKSLSKIKNGKELSEAVFYESKALVNLICIEVASDSITESEKKILK